MIDMTSFFPTLWQMHQNLVLFENSKVLYNKIGLNIDLREVFE